MLHQGYIYVALVLTPISFLTVTSIIILIRANVSSNKGPTELGCARHRKPFQVTLCIFLIAVTWSMCLAFLVLESNGVIIVFAILNICQGVLAVPFLVFESLKLMQKRQKLELLTSEALSEQTKRQSLQNVCRGCVVVRSAHQRTESL